MAAASSNEFQLTVPETAQNVEVKLGSDVTVPCHLSPEMSAVNMEIKCVCVCKNRQVTEGRSYTGKANLVIHEGNVSLLLKEPDMGEYLCQVISQDTTVEVTVQVNEYSDVQPVNQPPTFQSNPLTIHEEKNKTRERERMNLENSALMKEFVVNNMEEQKLKEQIKEMQTELSNHLKQLKEKSELLENKESQVQQLKKLVEDLQNQLQEKNTQLENLNKLINEKERTLENTVKEPETSKLETEQMKNSGGIKLFSDLAGKTNDGHRRFIETLENQIKDLREVPTVDESDIVLVFCPVVSRHDIDIEAALKKFTESTASKMKVLVVLHHTFDREKTVLDSSRCVNRTDILTVDCLFYEDTGLLDCQKNHDAMDKVVNWIIQQRKEKYVNVCQSHGPLHKNVAPNDNLKKENEKHPTELDKNNRNPKGKNKVSKPSSEKERAAKNPSQLKSRKIKLCSILAGKTNNAPERFIGTLKKQISNLKEVSMDESDAVLVFCPILSRAGTDIETALKRFTDSTGSKMKVLVVLHHTFDREKTVPDSSRCVNRTDILTVDCLFYEDTGLLECQKNDDAINKVVNWLMQQQMKPGSSSNNAQPVSIRTVKYLVTLPGDRQKYHINFLDALHRGNRGLMEVSTVQESDVILHFRSAESHAAVKDYKRTDKPDVDIVLHNTLDSRSVPKSSGCLYSPNVFIVDCIICEAVEELPECQINREAIDAVSQWLSTKIK